MVANSPRDADPTRLCQSFQARRDIDPIAENVVTLGIMSPRLMPMRNLIRCQG